MIIYDENSDTYQSSDRPQLAGDGVEDRFLDALESKLIDGHVFREFSETKEVKKRKLADKVLQSRIKKYLKDYKAKHGAVK